MAEIYSLTVLDKVVWSPTLFSFKTTRPDGFRFSSGQFVRLGLTPLQLQYYRQSNQHAPIADTASQDDPIFRAYSIVSSPYEEALEFFSVVVPDGAFTSQLQHLAVGDSLSLEMTPYGFLTLSRYQDPPPKDLWLLATGTGVAPFLSILQDLSAWKDYESIVLAYSVRYESDLAYRSLIDELPSTFGALVDNPARLIFVPIVTREVVSGCLNDRLPSLLVNGELEQAAGLSLSKATSHVMLCGNPKMVEQTKETLKSLGLSMNRRGVGNIAVENYW